MPQLNSTSIQQIDIPTNLDKAPQPIDVKSLARWLGINQGLLWYLIVKRVNHYSVFHLTKPKGGVRVIHAPNKLMKLVQNRILKRILNKFKQEDHFGAYVPGRGLEYTAQRHAGHATLIELDVKNFFGSTKRKHIREFFLRHGWVKAPAYAIADLLTVQIKKTFSVVPQGSPASPAICNLVANENVDRYMLQALSNLDPKWLYTRYSDNLFISHPDDIAKSEVDTVIAFATKILVRAGYQVNRKKTKVMRRRHAKRPQKMLGLVINEKPNIDNSTYKTLRAIVHNATKNGFSKVHGLPPTVVKGQEVDHLRGVINYYAHVCPTPKVLKLKAQFDAIAGNQSTYIIESPEDEDIPDSLQDLGVYVVITEKI